MTEIKKWDWHRFDTMFLINNLEDYIQETEKQFETLKKLAQKHIPEKPPNGSGYEFQEWQHYVALYEDRYEKDFTSKMRYSFIVLLHIVFESRLRESCNEIAKRNEIKLKENELNGGPIERAKNYLTIVAHIEIKNHQVWQAMTDNQKIRDCIVHTNGNVSKSKNSMRILEIGKKGIGITVEDGDLYISSKYCSFALDALRKFFDDIYDSAGFGAAFPDW